MPDFFSRGWNPSSDMLNEVPVGGQSYLDSMKSWDARAAFYGDPNALVPAAQQAFDKFGYGPPPASPYSDKYTGPLKVGGPAGGSAPGNATPVGQPTSAPPSNVVTGVWNALQSTSPSGASAGNPTWKPQAAGAGIPGYSKPQSFNVDQLMKFLTPQSPFQAYNFDDPFSDSSTGNNPF